ncbi:MAG: hypothetical protein AAF224_12580 [Pseudomonadota bacterium]
MCTKREHHSTNTSILSAPRRAFGPLFSSLKSLAIAVSFVFFAGAPASAGAAEVAETLGTVGGVALGDARDGVADRVYVAAPPGYVFVVTKETGSFLDCGADAEVRAADADGRDSPSLTCAVALTETIVIPAASESARLIIHY